MGTLFAEFGKIKPSDFTPAEMAGQCLMAPAFILDGEKEIQALEQQIRDLHIGSLCFFRTRSGAAANVDRTAVSEEKPASTDELELLKRLIERYQSAARTPLLIAIDAEWGLAMRVAQLPAYPYALCLGALPNGPEEVFELGRQLGRDLQETGIHWNLSPVVDLYLNPDNPVIGYRSFGSDPVQVAQLAHAYRCGMSEFGILHCLKHFPGHGDTHLDSHLQLPVIPRSKSAQSASEEIPYRLLLKSETDAVMAAHVAFPSLTGGSLEPASLSPLLLGDYLRGELGFNGVVVSDALNMGSVAKLHEKPGELERRCFESGCDVLCFPEHPEEAVNEICRRLPPERIRQSFERFWKLKARGLGRKSGLSEEESRDSYDDLMSRIARECLSLVHGKPEDVEEFARFEPGFAILGEGRSDYFISRCREELSQDPREHLVVALFPPSLKPSGDFGWEQGTWDRINALLQERKTALYLFGNPTVLERLDWDRTVYTLVAFMADEEFQRAAWGHFRASQKAHGRLPYPLRTNTAASQRYRMLGMMSGTSLDGLDMAYVEFEKNEIGWRYRLGPCQTLPYPGEWRKALSEAVSLDETRHQHLHTEYGRYLGERARDFLAENSLYVDAIGSHGHTSHHRPSEGVSFQLGNGDEIARISGRTVICDFRAPDVALGGEGAPLVPIGDEILFAEYDFCLNLGGISNISYRQSGRRIAFDVGMANMPLNYLSHKLGYAFDANGEWARSGRLDPQLLGQLDSLDYYRLSPPKSTGQEWFIKEVVPMLEKNDSPVADQLHTVVIHNCRQIRAAISNAKIDGVNGPARVLVTGGGIKNSFFRERLSSELNGVAELVVPSRTLIDYKEALIFAFLATLRLRGEVNVLSSVTGATRDHTSGSIHQP